MNRRQFITTACIGTATILSGCTSTDNSDGEGPLDGEWVLRTRVVNEDDEPREWRVESRSEDRKSFAAASGTVTPGDTRELELAGLLYDEQREVYVESDDGSRAVPWRPTECRRLFAKVTIVDGDPNLETECREE